jgi:Transposase DDE domain group 1
LPAFVALARIVANFWLGAGGAQTANNALAFIDSTLRQLGCKMVGLFHADSSFFDEAIPRFLEGGKIDYIISARLTHTLQAAIVHEARWWVLETGLELAEIANQAQGWAVPRRIVVARQSIKRKTLSLCADDPDLSGWRHGAMVSLLILPDVKVLRSHRERVGCENRIKEHKADFGLDSFVLNDFWATEAALRFGQARD